MIDENLSERMPATSGMKSLKNKNETESTNSLSCSFDSLPRYEKSHDIENSKDVSNKLTNKERVQGLIECLKKKQISKVPKEKMEEKSLKNPGASFQYRFLAQRNIIELQRSRLMEQEKIISELKLGILSKKNANKNCKYDMKALFQDCRMRLLGKVPLEYIPKSQELFVSAQAAPKIIQELEKRALERMKYREIIKERRKIMDETKKRIQEENLRKNHQMEEEERLKHLEILKQRHRKEEERMKIRQMNKEIFLRNWDKAVWFHERTILRKTFYLLKADYLSSLNNVRISEQFYEMNIIRKCFNILFNIVNAKYLMKLQVADNFWTMMLLKRSWQCFRENNIDGMRTWQVAEDFNNFRLERKIIKFLYNYTTKEKILQEIKNQQACYHYQRKLIFYTFFHWKSLPIVLKMEKVKEERKQKWRTKVLEILPDFSPSEI